jgi:hypothetical protein
LLRVVERLPTAKIPTVALPVADPSDDTALDAVADALTSPEYVYLLRVVEGPTQPTVPNAKIPRVTFPAADCLVDGAVAAVAAALVQPENVYLLRVVEVEDAISPKANIATVP